MFHTAAIVYCSPAGGTRHVAEVIETELNTAARRVEVVNLGKNEDLDQLMADFENERICLFIGSPVYVNRPVPSVMDFIARLPKNAEAWAVPFVTWGGASSGIALHDMGRAFSEKGIRVIGAAKVLAVHSTLWRSKHPLGEGHPDEADDQAIRELVAEVLKKCSSGSPEPVSLKELAYQPPAVHAEMEKMNLSLAKGHMPEKRIDETACTECRFCADNCPVQAITLSPLPVFGDNCICCLKCARECPEEAILVDLTQSEERIRGIAARMKERPGTKIFI